MIMTGEGKSSSAFDTRLQKVTSNAVLAVCSQTSMMGASKQVIQEGDPNGLAI
jgi:hypothetical protein